ncbi:hypothetical protein KEM09_13155 [Carboxylicivirga mesophila]|uniref:DUF2141 domain-containing protein n=1 Tax=Carboxylicivirga mesophila TaxID=1166478 RepID=A0ABS5KBY9_9BACT|nr:hypothetical protein [Carboxylicivirga mesophila]MBS2212357.1 hypothetical protein [Carboxylicivirga mesophila]
METVILSATNRNEYVELTTVVKLVKIEVSRQNCKDVLLEVVDEQGQSKGKPLEKWLPQIKAKNIAGLRFMMNDFSTKPIEIKLTWK